MSRGSLAIKGGAKDEAVLCTASRTFTLRLAESSNTLLLSPGEMPKKAPPGGPPATLSVSASAKAYYELVPTAPRTAVVPCTCAWRSVSSASLSGMTPRSRRNRGTPCK